VQHFVVVSRSRTSKSRELLLAPIISVIVTDTNQYRPPDFPSITDTAMIVIAKKQRTGTVNRPTPRLTIATPAGQGQAV